LPEESTEYELFDQTILAMRASAWKNHKDILWASIKSSRSAHQTQVNREENNIFDDVHRGKMKVMDDGNGKIDKGKGKAVDKGKGKAVDKGKGKAVDKGYEEATPDSLGLLGLDNSLELFE
jgi:hypothetical protein